MPDDEPPIAISIIVPCWRGDAVPPETAARWLRSPSVREVIMATAGEGPVTEGKPPGFRTVHCIQQGRGNQMNEAARVATGNVFLFQHADTELTEAHLQSLESAMRTDASLGGGAFRRRFDERHPHLRWLEPWEALRGRRFGPLFGDQSLFVRQSVFVALGGFADIPLMEDVDFSCRLRRRFHLTLLAPAIRSSARKHLQQGRWQTTLINALFLLFYMCGISPQKLHTWYYRRASEVGPASPRKPAPTSAFSSPAAPTHPTFGEAFRFWLKLGFISFGGPTGQIAIMHEALVERARWIDEERFLHGLNFCMLLPGPEAQQLAIYFGWLLHRAWGGIMAGVLFVLPSAFILWALSYIYVAFGNVPAVAATFYGLKPAVMAIVASAVLRIGGKALNNEVRWTVAALAFAAIFFCHVPFPVVIIAAGLTGWIGSRVAREKFLGVGGHGAKQADPLANEANSQALCLDLTVHTAPTWRRAWRVLAVCIALWWTPVLLAGLWQGWQGTLFRQGVFFSKAAAVTFGGAYAVLPYVSQQAVETYGWLAPGQMLDGLGLAETTPGPLIMVLQFVGFLGGWNHPGGLPPLLAATLGAALTTWTTFVPCFLWVFLGAPHIAQLRRLDRISAALSTVTAAVAGVILNLAVWFAIHVLLPRPGVFDWFAAVLATLAFVAMQHFKVGVFSVIFGSGLAGLVYRLILGG